MKTRRQIESRSDQDAAYIGRKIGRSEQASGRERCGLSDPDDVGRV